MKMKPVIISAVGTPLEACGSLDRDALAAHLSDQWQHKIDGVLIAGSMGQAQFLTDEAYRSLIRSGVEISKGRGQVYVGVGDAGYHRVRHRIELVNQLRVDGVVVLTPYLIKFQNDELINYYTALADESKAPVYLYDLPALVGWSIPIEVILELASHPNIHGIKCSCPLSQSRMIEDQVGEAFRVIHAQPLLLDMLLLAEVCNHLDGVFSLAPSWTMAMCDAAVQDDWQTVGAYQKKINTLVRLLMRFGVFQSYSALLNARGIPGDYAPRPLRALSEEQRSDLLEAPIARDLLGSAAK